MEGGRFSGPLAQGGAWKCCLPQPSLWVGQGDLPHVGPLLSVSVPSYSCLLGL